MGYIYQADTYCDDCGDAIRAKIKANDHAPEDELEHSSYDSDDYPKEASVETEEADSPQYCAACHDFLRNPLTSVGYKYVQDQLNSTGLKSPYVGSMSVILKAWASWYDFTYWTVEDCQDDGRHNTAGWYSREVF